MESTKQQEMDALMRDMLDTRYFSLDVLRHVLEEDVRSGRSTVRATLVDSHSGEEKAVSGEGVGLVDAFFNALIEWLVQDYQSLQHIRFRSFSVDGDLETGKKGSRSDSKGITRLEVDNQVGRTFKFEDASGSVTASSIRVTLAAVEYFVNSEKTFFVVRGYLEDAQKNGRQDMVERYTRMLSNLVKNASYAD